MTAAIQTKPRWFPVEGSPSDRPTPYMVMEGDGNPATSEVVGHYDSMGTAHRVARLHNNHVSVDPVLREVDIMFQHEIHFGIVGFWDGDISWFLGAPFGGSEGATLVGSQPTIEEALAEMVNAERARSLAAGENFGRNYRGDVAPLDVYEHPYLNTMADTFAATHGPFSLAFTPTTTDPYEPPWTLTLGADPSHGWGGYTAEEAIEFASARLAAS